MNYCINLNWIFWWKHNFYDNSENRFTMTKTKLRYSEMQRNRKTIEQAAKQQIGCAFMCLWRKDAN